MMRATLLFIFLCAFSLPGFAQEKTITGIITTAGNGQPLPGASIQVQGTTKGVTSDFDGNYEIDVEVGQTLVFNYLGYNPQNITVGDQERIDIALKKSQSSLGEVVVIGYGSSKKEDLTAAISSVDSTEITKQPALTATQALQGKVSGVNITNSSAPGATPNVTIRGLGTLSSGRNPLYVVDGTPVDNIDNISPSSIKSMDFLKDAAASSIYGVRAANGVIIVTTKRGGKGKPRFKISSYYGISTLLNGVEMSDADQYITYFNEENSVLGASTLQRNQRYDTDWYDELTRPGNIQNNVFSVTGGSDYVDYYFNFDYFEQDGILEGQKYRRTNLTSNNTYKLFDDRLKIKQNLNLSFRKGTPKPFSAFNTAYRQSPLVPVYYPNGRFGQPLYNRTTGIVTTEAGEGESIGRLTSHGNPVAEVAFANDENTRTTIQGNISAELKLTDDLTFTSRFGARQIFSKNRSFRDNKFIFLSNNPTQTAEDFENFKAQNPESLTYVNNSLSFNKTENFKYNWDNFFNYNTDFDKHHIEATLGMSQESINNIENYYALAYDVPDKEQYWSINFASDQYDKTVQQGYVTPDNYMSYFGRIQYNFDDKYYLSGSIRRDGSSNFSNNEDYWGYFPSAGIGWTISRESFLENQNVFDFLKLRVSYGELGNAQIPFNQTQIFTSAGSSSQNYVFGPDQRLIFGANLGSPAQNLSWEVVSEWNAGLDFRMFNDKLSGNVNVYRKETERAILNVQPLLNSTFASSFYDFGAQIVNKGVEVALNYKGNIGDDFSYTVGGTYSYNKNNVANVRNNYGGQTGGDLNNGRITKRLAEDEPLGSFWVYNAIGVWQTQEEIDNNPSLGEARPGFLRYEDVNEDGVIDQRDRKYMGSYVPNYNFGISITANYKQFDLSIDTYGAGGNKVYNGLKNTRIGGENIPEDVFQNRWTGPGSTNEYPGALHDTRPSSHYLEDGDYFRVNNITLGYTIPNNTDFISNARVYLSAQNPFIFTGYSGFTPELSSNGDPLGGAGIELSAYPITKTFILGLNIDL